MESKSLLMQSTREWQRLVVLHLVVYIYDCQADTFRALPDMPLELPQQLLLAHQALHDVAAGALSQTPTVARICCQPNTSTLPHNA